MMNFMDEMAIINNKEPNISITENDALGYRTSGSALVDLNFSISSLRNESDDIVIQSFLKAFNEDKELALKWLFYVRDIRMGVGERRLFRVILRHLSIFHPNEIKHLIQYIPEYGRWDDLLELLETNLEHDAILMILNQIEKDHESMKNGKPISLIGKWLPSCNTSSKRTIKLGKRISRLLNMSERKYRILLSKFRKYLNVVETKMSNNNWDEIDYQAVPSNANLLYKDAFLRHDEVRRTQFLKELEEGSVTINSSTLYPYQIFAKYDSMIHNDVDPTLEHLWYSLPNTLKDNTKSILVVADGSGSMLIRVGPGGASALSIAQSIAIYFAERLHGNFKNKFITFSSYPEVVNLNHLTTLREKITYVSQFDDCTNTDIEAVFNLVLETALVNKAKQEELPSTILVISDMEFDDGLLNPLDSKLFDSINNKFKSNGYQLPKLAFWNLNSRSGTIPLIENDLGIALVSGFSPHITSMILSGELDPYECLKETLLSNRYQHIKAME